MVADRSSIEAMRWTKVYRFKRCLPGNIDRLWFWVGCLATNHPSIPGTDGVSEILD